MVNIHASMNSRKSTRLQTKERTQLLFLRRITFTGQSHRLYLLLKSRILYITSSILHLSTHIANALHFYDYSVVLYSCQCVY